MSTPPRSRAHLARRRKSTFSTPVKSPASLDDDLPGPLTDLSNVFYGAVKDAAAIETPTTRRKRRMEYDSSYESEESRTPGSVPRNPFSPDTTPFMRRCRPMKFSPDLVCDFPATPVKPSKQMRKTDEISLYSGRLRQDFEIQDVVGKGKFGTVYHVRSKVDGMDYAIKRTQRMMRSGIDCSRNMQEVYALAAITDTSAILRYYSSWVEDEYVYLQLELCEDDLESKMKRNVTINSMDVFSILRDVLLGLNVLHQNNLVHLDVKPGNILIKQGRYKLGDFGLATPAHQDRHSVSPGDSRYMANELLSDNVLDLTKCDIFSLGISAYEVITKETLPGNGEVWHELRHGTMVFPPGTDAELVEIVQLLMHPTASARPTAGELLQRPLLASELERELYATKQANETLLQQLKQASPKGRGKKLRRVHTIS